MNREIKFRAWSEKLGMRQLDQITIGDKSWTCEGGNGVSLIYQPHIIVMQYTGVKDRLGVEIYEYDIIEVDWLDARYNTTRHLVEWSETDCSFIFPGGSPYNDAPNYFTVIGNKYDNPELLKI